MPSSDHSPHPTSKCAHPLEHHNHYFFLPFTSYYLFPPLSAAPQGTCAPHQLHSKQTAAGSVRLPGICLRERREEGSKEEGRKKAMSRVGGEARRTRRNCKDEKSGAGEWEATETVGVLQRDCIILPILQIEILVSLCVTMFSCLPHILIFFTVFI